MMGNNTFQLFEKRGISIFKFSNSLSKSTNDCLNSSQLFFNSSAIFLFIFDFTTSPYNIRAVRIIKSESKLEYAPERTLLFVPLLCYMVMLDRKSTRLNSSH